MSVETLFPPPIITLRVFCLDGGGFVFADGVVEIDKESVSEYIFKILHGYAHILGDMKIALATLAILFVVEEKGDGAETVCPNGCGLAIAENRFEESRGNGHFFAGPVAYIVFGVLGDAAGDDITGI